MAIELSTEYPTQVDTDAAYPYGKPRNRSTPTTQDGTPFEEKWVQDLHGFLQAILVTAGTTPSGTPDSATVSQLLDSMRVIARTILSGQILNINSGGYHFVYGTLEVKGGGVARLQATSEMEVESGSEVNVESGGEINVESGGNINVNSGGDIEIEDGGEINVQNGGEINLAAGAIVDAVSGANIHIRTGAQIHAYAGSEVQIDGVLQAISGAEVRVADGATLTIDGGGNWPILSSRGEWLPCRGHFSFSTPAQWTDADGAGFSCALNTACKMYCRVGVPDHFTITEVNVRWNGPTHPTWPPQNLTTFSAYWVDSTAGGKTLLVETPDTSAQVTYEAFHVLKLEGFSQVGSPAGYLLIEMLTESGTNAVLGSMWVSCEMLATMTELRNG